jgi:predicted HicB family RNase H-like nuclease
MVSPAKQATVRSLDRINLRLPTEVFDAIDQARLSRPGNISRNTWITEAIEEKLQRGQGDEL